MSHPIDEYLDALELYKDKKRRLAAENVAKSLGGEEATEPILSSLDKIFDKDTLVHKAVLDTIVSEVKRREKNVGRRD